MFVLYLHKKNTTKFITNNSPQCPLSTGCENKYTEKSTDTKFFGLETDNSCELEES
jgi:hypothetical protein